MFLGVKGKTLTAIYLITDTRSVLAGAGVSKVSDQIASCDTEAERETRSLLLHPFVPIVCIADEKETIR